MAKTKRISINEFEKVVKENYENVVVKEWHGIPVTITKTLPLKEMMALVATVVSNCFMDDGSYLPEVAQPLLDCGVVERYTNISLPKSLAARYEFVYQSGILNFILPEINTSQYNDVVVAVRDKVDYLCDSNISEFKKAVEQMAAGLDEIRGVFSDSLNGLTADDIHKVIEIFGDSSSAEEKVVKVYTNKLSQSLHVIGDEE